MSNKKLAFLLSAILLALGGLMFHVHRMSEEEKLEAQILKEQERMVLYAVNHYEGIEKIEFTSFEKNDMTGVWSAEAEINNEYQVTFKVYGFDGDLELNQSGSNKTGSHLLKKEMETENMDSSRIEIVYFNKVE